MFHFYLLVIIVIIILIPSRHKLICILFFFYNILIVSLIIICFCSILIGCLDSLFDKNLSPLHNIIISSTVQISQAMWVEPLNSGLQFIITIEKYNEICTRVGGPHNPRMAKTIYSVQKVRAKGIFLVVDVDSFI